MTGKWLRTTRIVVAVTVAVMLTLLFLPVALPDVRALDVLARLQLFPAAMSFSMTVFVSWLIVTIIFGRIYCSTVCPLGFFQDVMARSVRTGRKMRARHAYHYKRQSTSVRYIFLVLTLLSVMCGIGVIPVLLDPYSTYGRFVTYLLDPVIDIAASTPGRVLAGGVAGLGVAALTAIAVAWAAVKWGRGVCNSVCPVGTTLGLVSRFSVMHIDINTDRCIQCRRCEHACKARCIDLESHTVDTSRCVVCFDCLPGCPNDAIHYTASSHRLSLPMLQRIMPPTARKAQGNAASSAPITRGTDKTGAPRLIDRRRFLATGMIVAAAPVLLRADKAARAVASAAGKHAPQPSGPVYPPGASDPTYFLERCTGCSLCISRCPTGVLQAATGDYLTMRGLLHPVMRFADGRACSFTCTLCNNLCPTDALTPLSLREKQMTAIGLARVIEANCIHCGECAAACPRHAIDMKPLGGFETPVVNAGLCIGCGECQSVCPAYPFKAIFVDPKPNN